MAIGQRRVNTTNGNGNGKGNGNHSRFSSSSSHNGKDGYNRLKKFTGTSKRRIFLNAVLTAVFFCLVVSQTFRRPGVGDGDDTTTTNSNYDYMTSVAASASASANEVINNAFERSLIGSNSYPDYRGDPNKPKLPIIYDHSNDCTIPRFDVNDPKAVGLGSKDGPVLLEGWSLDPDEWTKAKLMGRVGEYPQYLKDLTVQPLRNKNYVPPTAPNKNLRTPKKERDAFGNVIFPEKDELCRLKGTDVAELVTTGKQDLLFFTNNKENKPFMSELQTQYEIPSVVRHIQGFDVFSAMGEGRYHSMHAHGESWLGQLAGRRMWYFLPPSTNPKPDRVDACGYMKGTQTVPPNVQSCVQNPGEIIWFPKDWLHATCAMDEWTAGVGAQQGPIIRQTFPQLNNTEFFFPNGMYKNRKKLTLAGCLGLDKDYKAIDVNGDGGDTASASAIGSVVAKEAPETKQQKVTSPTPKDSEVEDDVDGKVIQVAKANTNAKNTNTNAKQKDEDWKWFDGDLNAYYNSLEDQIHDRDPSKIASYAVHRWMLVDKKRSTEEHYELISRAVAQHHPQQGASSAAPNLKVFDGGCGLGSALMFFEGKHPEWDMTGHTISEEQHKFVETKLPKHNFQVNLRSYDEFEDDANIADSGKKLTYDVIYSIEAMIHSLDIEKTTRAWAEHLAPGGIVVIIDDYVHEGASKDADDMQAFSKSWLANVLITPHEFEKLANSFGLELVENRDLLKEYDVVKINYRNHKPEIKPIADRTHQGWMGSKWRQRLTVEGKLDYNMIVLKKTTTGKEPPRRLIDEVDEKAAIKAAAAALAVEFADGSDIDSDSGVCASVPSSKDDSHAEFTEITAQLMSGKGNNGGKPITCLSGWYCCDKGTEWYDNLDAHRTDNTAFLKLDRNLFGHYIDVFAKHLNEHYKTYPEVSSTAAAGATKGRFLDIGGTGSTASGMKQVTSKFQHFAGPLDYWILDSDPAAEGLDRTLFCDIDDCPAADTCGFDVTFSHTVLEHAKRPWKSFDTIARLTKKGGLTMHLVPWSYQYHATPDDNYRFSHKALVTLLEDRGFDVLEVGYDICTKPENMMKRIDEHYDVIWLTYVVGRKR